MSDLDFMQDFNPEKAAADASGGVVPPGRYDAMISKVELVDTKAGNGKMLKLQLKIIGPKHARRVVFGQIILKHDSEKAQEIGRATFGQLCVASGFSKAPADTRDLVGKVVSIGVTIERSPGYQDQNKINVYEKSDADAGGMDLPSAAPDDDIPF